MCNQRSSQRQTLFFQPSLPLKLPYKGRPISRQTREILAYTGSLILEEEDGKLRAHPHKEACVCLKPEFAAADLTFCLKQDTSLLIPFSMLTHEHFLVSVALFIFTNWLKAKQHGIKSVRTTGPIPNNFMIKKKQNPTKPCVLETLQI